MKNAACEDLIWKRNCLDADDVAVAVVAAAVVGGSHAVVVVV